MCLFSNLLQAQEQCTRESIGTVPDDQLLGAMWKGMKYLSGEREGGIKGVKNEFHYTDSTCHELII